MMLWRLCFGRKPAWPRFGAFPKCPLWVEDGHGADHLYGTGDEHAEHRPETLQPLINPDGDFIAWSFADFGRERLWDRNFVRTVAKGHER
jgi:hypothetical protein